jgi:hypothetical protein
LTVFPARHLRITSRLEWENQRFDFRPLTKSTIWLAKDVIIHVDIAGNNPSALIRDLIAGWVPLQHQLGLNSIKECLKALVLILPLEEVTIRCQNSPKVQRWNEDPWGWERLSRMRQTYEELITALNASQLPFTFINSSEYVSSPFIVRDETTFWQIFDYKHKERALS